MSTTADTIDSDKNQALFSTLLPQVSTTAVMAVTAGLVLTSQDGGSKPVDGLDRPATPDVACTFTVPVLPISPAPTLTATGPDYTASPAFGVLPEDVELLIGLNGYRHSVGVLDASDGGLLEDVEIPGIGVITVALSLTEADRRSVATLKSNRRVHTAFDIATLAIDLRLADEATWQLLSGEPLAFELTIPVGAPPDLPAATAALVDDLERIPAGPVSSSDLWVRADFGASRAEEGRPTPLFFGVSGAEAATLTTRSPTDAAAFRADVDARSAELEALVEILHGRIGDGVIAAMDRFEASHVIGVEGSDDLGRIPAAPVDQLRGIVAGPMLEARRREAIERVGDDPASGFARIDRSGGGNLYLLAWAPGSLTTESLQTRLTAAADAGTPSAFSIDVPAGQRALLEFVGPDADTVLACGYGDALSLAEPVPGAIDEAAALTSARRPRDLFAEPSAVGYSIPARTYDQRVVVHVSDGSGLTGQLRRWSENTRPARTTWGSFGLHDGSSAAPKTRELVASVEVSLRPADGDDHEPEVAVRYEIVDGAGS